MTTRTRTVGRIARLPIVPILAVMLGGAVAFFCFAMPTGLVERLVAASGVPALVPAAAPPLGMKAKILFALTCGLGSAMAVWLGFAALFDRPRPARQVSPMPIEPRDVVETVRVRRGDAHPDAPAPRPIHAVADLGEPLELTVLADDPEAPVEVAEPPASGQPDDDAIDAHFEDVPEDAAIEPAVADETVAESEPDPAPLPAPEPEAEPEPRDMTQPAASAGPAIPALAELMERLENGLSRRAADTHGKVTPLRPLSGAPDDTALREALDELQRIAGKRG